MNLLAVKMDKEKAEEVLSWKYEAPYDFYNNEMNEEELSELLNGTYSAVMAANKDLIGFFCTGKSAQVPRGWNFGVYEEEWIDMGLGMNPALVGQGNGTSFGKFVLKEIEEKSDGQSVRLTVASFNKRAIHLYEKLGFLAKDRFSTEAAEFITMVRAVK